jgi:hypothetical protein
MRESSILMTPPTCPYCGNNPVPHFLTWYFETSNVLYTPLRRIILYNPLFLALGKVFTRFNLPWFLTRVFLGLGILSEQNDITKCKVRRAQVLWEEGGRRGIKMNELLLFGKPFDVYTAEKSEESEKSEEGQRLKVKCKMLVFSGLPRPESHDAAALDVLDDKVILKHRFQENNLPVPQGDSCKSLGAALKIFKNISKPVIVKPRTGSRGRHTTTFIYTEEDLKKAFKIAKQMCFWVVVEEQLFGPVYRATVIDYKIRGVLRGDSPQVIGDGTYTITELISAKNSQTHPGVKEIIADDGTNLFLSRQNLNLSSVPKEGQVVNLTEKIGVSYGGSSSEDFEICHSDNKELFECAAKVAGDPIVGFDFIIADITKSWRDQKCGFIEANSLPFINLHHDPLLGKPRNIAQYVWELVGM